MRQYALYLALKELLTELGCPYSAIYYNDRDELKEGAVSIYVRSGVLSKLRRLADGYYIGKYDRVQLVIQTGRTKEEILQGMEFGNKLEDKLPGIFNKDIAIPSNKLVMTSDGIEISSTVVTGDPFNLTILQTNPQSGLISMGKTEQGLSLFSINIIVNYDI